MSHTSKIFEEVPVKVQNKNGFDLSHLNCGTSKCGQLVPVMCKLLPPNSDFTLGVNFNVELPPLATAFMGRIDAIIEGFVVPCSMLYGGWKQFISNQQSTMFPSNQSTAAAVSGGYHLPYFDLRQVSANGSVTQVARFDTLMASNDNVLEYLGYKEPAIETAGAWNSHINISLLPLLAYHLIWDVYYRNKQVTKTIFAVNPNNPDDGTELNFNFKNVSLIWHGFYFNDSYVQDQAISDDYSALFKLTNSLTFPDGISVFSTRQRNYARDYFTAATPDPQQGSASKLKFDTSAAEGEFTINALRAANSLQKFLETNNLSGDYADMMRNRWGTRPIDADFDEPYYLGRVVVPVYQKSVYQQDSSAKSGAVNPFAAAGAIGAKGAHGSFIGEGSIADKFHNSTWSYVMCLFSLVPHAAYGQGINRELQMLEIGDFPAPELQSIGNQEIYGSELYWSARSDVDAVFGYIPRYSRFKYMDDEVHGELRPTKTLHSFVLQRYLAPVSGYDIDLSTSFLEIGQSDLDDVFAVSTESMNLSCWYEIFFEFKVSMPLADFCIPTLGDIQDTHTIKSKQGGSRL